VRTEAAWDAHVLPQHYFLAGLGLDFTGRMEEEGAMRQIVQGIYTYRYRYISICVYMYV